MKEQFLLMVCVNAYQQCMLYKKSNNAFEYDIAKRRATTQLSR